MAISEKYPENVPWDLNIKESNYKSIKWILSNADMIYTFTRSRINDKYIYIQRNNGIKKAINQYEARFIFQRLFDEGYSLAAFS